MPTPNEGESREDFVGRCIPEVLDDGTAENNEQAAAVCNTMWEDAMSEPETGGNEEADVYTLARDALGLARSVINDGKMLTALAEAKQTDARKLANAMLAELEAKIREQEDGEREKAQAAKDARAQRYGISSIDGKPVTKPSEFAGIADSDFGDPVNYAYPADAEHARAALGYFNQSDARSSGGYSESDWSKVGDRLARLVSRHLEADYEFSGGKLVQKESSEAQPFTSTDILNLLAELDEMRARLAKFVPQTSTYNWNLTVNNAGTAQNVVEDFKTIQALSTVSVTELAESSAGIIALSEAEPQAADNPNREPLRVEFALIRPGFGNKKDNNYYPAEMLKRDCHVFEGVKMYTTDHNQGEKSERTEVAVVEKMPLRFLEDGTPVGLAAIFDPVFAEKTRNRAKQGHLGTLENSILGRGRVRDGEIDGRKANIVEALTEGVSVDWVTKAGAGGRALNLAESDNEEVSNMTVEENRIDEQKQQPEPEPVRETAEEVVLNEADVSSILAEAKLPDAAKKRLEAAEYKDADELKAAINAEAEYIQEFTKAGQPVIAPGQPASEQKSKPLAEREAAMDAVNRKWLGTRARKN